MSGTRPVDRSDLEEIASLYELVMRSGTLEPPPGLAPYLERLLLDQLRANGHPALDEDVVRLSPFVRRHLGVHGDYSFLLPELAGTLR
ncbi:MAG: hypothetical protein LC790_08900, partial [Actinobacteria bacterium]|nr:hypothetical protein [Actinomycetota bacterium]MCA1699000.1 hypothetical protein [Actinomycetota bacterium]